ncbi:MAG: type II secretion system protein M [Marinobacter sp.]|nr:type II secretion system protein M [Marinobacter sp.]
MWNRLSDYPPVQKLVTQYDQLPRRDQQALTLLAVAVMLAIVYFAIWRPAVAYREDAEAARDNAAELVSWMQANQARIQQLAKSQNKGGSSTSTLSDSRALMSTVTRSAGEAGLTLQRFEPSGERAIRVWLEKVPFNQVAAWLEKLTTDYGIQIDQAALDRGDNPGMVSVRLTLQI